MSRSICFYVFTSLVAPYKTYNTECEQSSRGLVLLKKNKMKYTL